MKPSERICTYPRMGRRNTELIGNFLRDLDLNVLPPPPTTDKTIKLGVKNCASMVCYPLKITLGNYIESLNAGANTLLAYDTRGECRFRLYNSLHLATLTGLGYDNFEMQVLNPKNIVGKLSKISGKSRLKVMGKLCKHYKKLKQEDKQELSTEKPNIAIIGEIYSCIDEKANQGLVEKIERFGCNAYNTCTITSFMEDKISIFNPLKFFKKDPLIKYKKESEKYMGGWRAGHAFENITNLLYLVDKGIDSVCHSLPLSCCPETSIEIYINTICKNNKIPLLRIPLDENSAEKNLETRLEVFTEMIKDKKRRGM